MPTEVSAADLFDNPFYGELNQYFQSSIDQDYAKQKKSLDNNLNARNLVGGSYDAYNNSLLNQDFGTRRQQAQGQARLGAADAWTQAYNNLLAGIGGLDAHQANAQNLAYQPMNMYLAYQNSMTPLQQATAGIYGQQMQNYMNKPGLYQNILSGVNTAANLIGAFKPNVSLLGT